MSSTEPLHISESIGKAYSAILLEVGFTSPAVTDEVGGKVYAVQSAPRLAIDSADTASASFVRLDVAPHQAFSLAAAEVSGATGGAEITTFAENGAVVIVNGNRSIRVPESGFYEPALPGPILGMRIGDGAWYGTSTTVNVPLRASIFTEIESIGPVFVQWRTTFRWGGKAGFSFVGRWAAGADTAVIVEEIFDDSDAAWEWQPIAPTAAQTFNWGGGESELPMKPLKMQRHAEAVRGAGRRTLSQMNHVSYYNQWGCVWAAFEGAGAESAGLFVGWSTKWARRGHVRPVLQEDDHLGGIVRFPIKRGRRIWGLVIATVDEIGMHATSGRCLMNTRKCQLSDVTLAKQASWELDPPVPDRSLRLLDAGDLAVFRERLAVDPEITAALERAIASQTPDFYGYRAAALWKNDSQLMAAGVPPLVASANGFLEKLRDGGYERVIIFDGRHAKQMAFDIDAYWATGALSEADYRAIRKGCLALAYVFADEDYCRYNDFWHKYDAPDEGVHESMADTMGDSPVPPNFCSEFFSTTGVMAELYDNHPMRDEWRRFSIEMTEKFLEAYHAEDGTYLESMNYHSHAFDELLCLYYAQRQKGVRDWFAHPKVRGSLEHFSRVRLPLVREHLPPLDPNTGAFASIDAPLRSPLPANGNSGSNGIEQQYSGYFMVAASLYAKSDPAFASELVCAWREAGKPLLDHQHAVLSLLTMHPTISPAAPPIESRWWRTLGVASKATRRDGEPVWCLFRAGRATHHMDFDQGNLHLAAFDTVLLGEHGYHSHDKDGKHIGGERSALHSMVTYGPDRRYSAGYTGLEIAPEPLHVRLGDDYDWCVHRIETTNFRCSDLFYNNLIPVQRIVHFRHYLFVKPDYFVIWDTFDEAHDEARFRLQPFKPVTPLGGGAFRAGEAGEPNLLIQFAVPSEPEVVENEQYGPLWSFAVRQPAGAPFLAVLQPQRDASPLSVAFDEASLTLRVAGPGFDDEIALPREGDPILLRKTPPG